jgi:hypothetical protein
MWVKKSELELLDDEARRRSREKRTALAVWAFFTIFPSVVAPRYGVHASPGHYLWQMPVRRAIAVTTFSLLVAALVSGIGVYFWYWLPRRNGRLPKVLVCPKCENVKRADGNSECTCGGRYVDLDTVKWVEHGSRHQTDGNQ